MITAKVLHQNAGIQLTVAFVPNPLLLISVLPVLELICINVTEGASNGRLLFRLACCTGEISLVRKIPLEPLLLI